MDAVTAERQLRNMVQAAVAPLLTAAEIADLLSLALTTDSAGRNPGTTGYVATYSYPKLRRAAGEGWLQKAGKVVNEYKLATGGGKSFERDGVYKMCMSHAKAYGGGYGRIGTSTVG